MLYKGSSLQVGFMKSRYWPGLVVHRWLADLNPCTTYISLTINLFRSGIAFYFHLFSPVQVTCKAKKNMCVYGHMSKKSRVGRFLLIFIHVICCLISSNVLFIQPLGFCRNWELQQMTACRKFRRLVDFLTPGHGRMPVHVFINGPAKHYLHSFSLFLFIFFRFGI
jgi:hypothetical protein